mgnify:CR=1 FL=1
MENREIRSTSAPSVTGRKVSGVAVAFRSPSRPLYEQGKRFIEVILPEAITYELIQRCDIRALVDHDRARLLARSNKGKGTLKLTRTEFGLEYSFEAPHTADGDYVVEMVKRGDIEGSSFHFYEAMYLFAEKHLAKGWHLPVKTAVKLMQLTARTGMRLLHRDKK